MDGMTDLEARKHRLGLSAETVEERFIRGTGPGGQKINKTSSCVHLIHKPTRIEVRCQQERSLTQNRHIAWKILCFKLERRKKERELERAAEKTRHRSRTPRRSRGAKRELLRQKNLHSRKKQSRRRPDADL